MPDFQPSRRARQASGQPISQLMAQALADPDLISLAAGFVDGETLPVEISRQAWEGLASDQDELRQALQYGTTVGYPPLREAVLERLVAQDGHHDGVRASIDQLVIGAGSNQLLQLISDCLLEPGDFVLCAAPSYFVYLGTVAGIGAVAHGVETDEQGMIPEALEDQLKSIHGRGELARVKAIYVVSYFDNPRGTTISIERRQQLLEIADRWSKQNKIYILEDIAYRDLRYRGAEVPSIRSLDQGGRRTAIFGTFSKSFSPGIRVGWGLFPRELVAPVCDQKGNADFGSPNLNQHLMNHVLRQGLLEAHIERLRATYRSKLDAMLHAAAEQLAPLPGVHWYAPQGGLYLWVELPASVDTGPQSTLFQKAIGQGVLYVPGRFCYPTSGVEASHHTMRLSFGVQTPERIRQGMTLLASAIRECI